jgi:putative transposase
VRMVRNKGYQGQTTFSTTISTISWNNRGLSRGLQLMVGMAAHMDFFNAERPHQSLAYQTPDQVYRTGIGGGAMILDKFSSEHDEEKAKPGQRRAAAVAEEITA